MDRTAYAALLVNDVSKDGSTLHPRELGVKTESSSPYVKLVVGKPSDSAQKSAELEPSLISVGHATKADEATSAKSISVLNRVAFTETSATLANNMIEITDAGMNLSSAKLNEGFFENSTLKSCSKLALTADNWGDVVKRNNIKNPEIGQIFFVVSQ